MGKRSVFGQVWGWLTVLTDLWSRHWQPLLLLVVCVAGLVAVPAALLGGLDWRFLLQGPGAAFAFKLLIGVFAPWFIMWQLRVADHRLGINFNDQYHTWPPETRGRYHAVRMLAYCVFFGLLFGL